MNDNAVTEKVENRGGRRAGAGRKAFDPLVRKAMPTFRIEKWFLDYINTFDDPAKIIMECVCSQHGISREKMLSRARAA